MKKIKNTAIAACAVFCAVLAFSCNTGGGDIESGASYDWNWEVTDDKNPNQFAPGVSTLFGYDVHPTKYSQAYKLNEPYVFGQPETGWYKIEEVLPGLEAVVMEDAKGYDESLEWPNNKGKGSLVPLKVPKTVKTMGPKGEEVDAFYFYGTMWQKGSESEESSEWIERDSGPTDPILSPNDYRLGAGWPSISVYATPPGIDEDPTQEIRKAFQAGYGYTFWIKPMKDFIVYRTSVENWDYRPNEGHEPSHWYGTGTGRDGTADTFTPAPVGEWTQVKVIYDPWHPDYNVGINWWIWTYGIQQNYQNDKEPYDIYTSHDKNHSIRIVWNFQLQHNGGNEGGSSVEYSVVTGRHEYEVYLYGLEILRY
ncbi:MAG: hypothetical protein FWH41_00310 [Treponema sp.]|nr:hypothetical protein [Treponema sp.]